MKTLATDRANILTIQACPLLPNLKIHEQHDMRVYFDEAGVPRLEVNSIWQVFFNCLFVSTLGLEFQRENGIILGPGTG